jgi:hypothetical protein
MCSPPVFYLASVIFQIVFFLELHAATPEPPTHQQIHDAVAQLFRRENTNTDEGGTAVYLETLEVVRLSPLPDGKYRVNARITDVASDGSAFDVVSKPYTAVFILSPRRDELGEPNGWKARRAQ